MLLRRLLVVGLCRALEAGELYWFAINTNGGTSTFRGMATDPQKTATSLLGQATDGISYQCISDQSGGSTYAGGLPDPMTDNANFVRYRFCPVPYVRWAS